MFYYQSWACHENLQTTALDECLCNPMCAFQPVGTAQAPSSAWPCKYFPLQHASPSDQTTGRGFQLFMTWLSLSQQPPGGSIHLTLPLPPNPV